MLADTRGPPNRGEFSGSRRASCSWYTWHSTNLVGTDGTTQMQCARLPLKRLRGPLSFTIFQKPLVKAVYGAVPANSLAVADAGVGFGVDSCMSIFSRSSGAHTVRASAPAAMAAANDVICAVSCCLRSVALILWYALLGLLSSISGCKYSQSPPVGFWRRAEIQPDLRFASNVSFGWSPLRSAPSPP